jgi:hypothetical protein
VPGGATITEAHVRLVARDAFFWLGPCMRRKVMATKTESLKVATSPAISTEVCPSRNWSRAMPPGPDASVKITEEYAKLVARDVYFWAWPMVNIYNRRLLFSTIK